MSCGSLSEGTQQKSAYWSKSESAEWEKTVRLPRRERAIREWFSFNYSPFHFFPPFFIS